MSLAQALISYAQSGGKNDNALYRALAERDRDSRMGPFNSGGGGASFTGREKVPPYAGYSPTGPAGRAGFLQLPTTWRGTHDTSGADWNDNRATAADIMAKAGTMVGAPEPGTVTRHGGAQGGQALYFRADDGSVYWIGHLENALGVGKHVRKGGRIATVSPHHANPHVHIDAIRSGY